MSLVPRLDELFYPGVRNGWDDAAFRAFILSRVRHDYTILDLGAGAGIVPEMNFKGTAREVYGVDPDPRVMTNPYLDVAKIGVGESIPFDSQMFDVVFADNVLEHLDNPSPVFDEVARVLKVGGKFLFKTPNKLHYMPTIARMTPHWFHQYYNKKRGRQSDDTFPTRYRANTAAAVTQLGVKSGLSVGTFCFLESRPEYLRLSIPTYLAGIAYERMVNASDSLERFRILLMGELVKRDADSTYATMSRDR